MISGFLLETQKFKIMPILSSVPLKPFPLNYFDGIYAGGVVANGSNTERYNSDGTSALSLNYTGAVYDLFVSENNIIYTAGQSDGVRTTKKYNSSGSLIWGVNHGGNVYGIDVYSDGRVATGGVVANGNTTRVYDTNGNLLWSANHGATVNSVAFDVFGNLYTGGIRTNNITIRKYNTNGVLQWSRDTLRNVNSIGFKTNQFDQSIVVAMDGNNSDYSVKEYDLSGTFLTGIGSFDANEDAHGVYCPKTSVSIGGTRVDVVIAYKTFNPSTSETNGNVSLYNDTSGLFATYITAEPLTDVVIDDSGNIYAISDDAPGYIYKNPERINSWSIIRGGAGYCIDVNNKG